MLNKKINKNKRIAKAQYGLAMPFGNPYLSTNGLATFGNSITQTDNTQDPYNFLNYDSTNALTIRTNNNAYVPFQSTAISTVANSKSPKKPKEPKDPKNPSNLKFDWNMIGRLSDITESALGDTKNEFSGKYKTLNKIGNQVYDYASNTMMAINPAIGGLMKVGGLAFKYIDMGKKARDFGVNKSTVEQVGGSYGGSLRDIYSAEDKSGKKYGLFGNKQRRSVDNFINDAEVKQNAMTNIANDAADLSSMAANMSDLNHIQYLTNLNGGYDQRYMRMAKFGDKLRRVKRLKISSRKSGGDIKEPINTWQPVITQFKSGGEVKSQQKEIIKDEPKITYEIWYESVPKDRVSDNYDLKRAFEVFPFEELEAWRTASIDDLKAGKNHLRSVYELPNGDYEFLKLGTEKTNPEIHFETDTYYSGDNKLKDTHDLVFENDRYFYRRKPQQFKNGGKSTELEAPKIDSTNQKNIIPEGALHAHKHNMDNAENLTKKGIPVIDIDGEQQAEIEKNEIIFTLEVTKKIEELYSKYKSESSSIKDKNEAAIEAGKLLVKEILFNTDDRTSLINTLKQGGVINEPK